MSCLTTSLPTSALVRLFIFCQSDGREAVSHLNLHSLPLRSSVLSCSLAIWVSSRQITYVHALRYPVQLLIQVTESPTRSVSLSKKELYYRGVPVVAQWLTIPTRNQKVADSIPGLAQWVKDTALPWLWCKLAAAALIRPVAWEPPCAMGVALEKTKKKKKRNCIISYNKES